MAWGVQKLRSNRCSWAKAHGETECRIINYGSVKNGFSLQALYSNTAQAFIYEDYERKDSQALKRFIGEFKERLGLVEKSPTPPSIWVACSSCKVKMPLDFLWEHEEKFCAVAQASPFDGRFNESH